MAVADTITKRTSKDYASDQEIKWCPGCGDYSILKQTQTTLAEIGIPNEELVFISGIGCSSRFPYYMNSYGMHSIHGRAPAVVSGLKSLRPELSVWMITGDGDALSIGGNHMMHLLRRNFDINVLLFNNEIYGLTKGQYSPTSPEGRVTKSTPMGSLDAPINPLAFALGSNGTFVARSMDRDPKHLRSILTKANDHKGTSLVEIYQNCNVFNDGAFFVFTEKDSKPKTVLFMEDGQPLTFGLENQFGIKLDGTTPRIVEMEKDGVSLDELWIHDINDLTKAQTLTRFFEDPRIEGNFPRPFGIFYQKEKQTYEQTFIEQNKKAIETKGEGDLDALLAGTNTWTIK